jgi:predicted AlkP superfamily pyrophosphatase or phosphodiesterase
MRTPFVLGPTLAALLAVAANSRTAPAPEPNGGPQAPAAADSPRVKLAVLVVFDQMRGDYPEKWKDLFGKGGFVRIQTDGATFTNCYYPYGTTTTGPGHASMLSGTCGDRHGIVNNTWYEGGKSVYCAGSPRYEFVPPPAGKPDGGAEELYAGNPDRMLAETVADTLRAAHPKAKIFGLSLKDRSAILPTGKKPDGAFWFKGRFVTSTYYAERLPAWVERFNASGAADRWFGKEWTRVRTDLDYLKWSGPDDATGEGKGAQMTTGPAKGWSQGRTFPHPMNPPAGPGSDKPNGTYYTALANSGFGNEFLLEFAKECVTAEKLGADDVPDLLVVSFSSNDLIGHTWGPDSQEVLDVTLRSDAAVAELLRFLDEKVGKGQYLVGITADHGVCPLPEVESPYRKGAKAKRVNTRELVKAVEEQLTAKFGAPKGEPGAAKKPAWVEATAFPWIYLNPKVAAAAGKTREEVAKAAAGVLKANPDVARALTRAELEAGFPADDVIGNRMKRSYFPERCGDLCVVLNKWDLPWTPSGTAATLAVPTGTTHGAPYDYDAHVPFLLYGPGISGGSRDERTTPQAMAAVFARWLGVPKPNKAEFPIPSALGEK